MWLEVDVLYQNTSIVNQLNQLMRKMINGCKPFKYTLKTSIKSPFTNQLIYSMQLTNSTEYEVSPNMCFSVSLWKPSNQ